MIGAASAWSHEFPSLADLGHMGLRPGFEAVASSTWSSSMSSPTSLSSPYPFSSSTRPLSSSSSSSKITAGLIRFELDV